MVSFVHPGHTIGNLNSLADLGFTNFRELFIKTFLNSLQNISMVCGNSSRLLISYFGKIGPLKTKLSDTKGSLKNQSTHTQYVISGSILQQMRNL